MVTTAGAFFAAVDATGEFFRSGVAWALSCAGVGGGGGGVTGSGAAGLAGAGVGAGVGTVGAVTTTSPVSGGETVGEAVTGVAAVTITEGMFGD